MPPGAVYVGRRSRYGNPFRLDLQLDRAHPLRPFAEQALTEAGPGGAGPPAGSRDVISPGTRLVATIAYRHWISAQPALLAEARRLAGLDLACWCPLPEPGQPDNCHGAVLLEIANA
jgi:hypothetical protein